MQNKGLIRLIAILIGLVCVYQLYFTYKAVKVENDATAFGTRRAKIENPGATQVELERLAKIQETRYLDSIQNQPVYNFFGLRKYSFKEVKEFQLPLGLDLKGGMNVTLEVSVVDLIHALSGNSSDSTFNAAIRLALKKQNTSQEDFVTLFGKSFEQIDPNAKLAAIFNTLDLRDKVSYNSTNAQVLTVIRKETDAAIDNSFQILRTRIDRFGVTQPNIQQLQTKGRILVELPGIKDANRVRKLLQGTANLEFWETYENSEVYTYMLEANKRLKELKSVQTTTASTVASAVTTAKKDTTKANSLVSEIKKQEKDLVIFSVDITQRYHEKSQVFKKNILFPPRWTGFTAETAQINFNYNGISILTG